MAEMRNVTVGGRTRNYVGSEKKPPRRPAGFGSSKTGRTMSPEHVAQCVELARQDREREEREAQP